MHPRSTRLPTALLVVLVVGLTGCISVGQRTAALPSPATVAGGGMPVPSLTSTPVPAATRTPASAPRPTSMSVATATWTPSPATIELTVLHTNDNWGETEPCG